MTQPRRRESRVPPAYWTVTSYLDPKCHTENMVCQTYHRFLKVDDILILLNQITTLLVWSQLIRCSLPEIAAWWSVGHHQHLRQANFPGNRYLTGIRFNNNPATGYCCSWSGFLFGGDSRWSITNWTPVVALTAFKICFLSFSYFNCPVIVTVPLLTSAITFVGALMRTSRLLMVFSRTLSGTWLPSIVDSMG